MSGRRLRVAAAVVDGTLVPGDVAVVDGQIAEVGLAPVGTGTAVPGFVDLQVNGFAGVDFLRDADDDAWHHAAAHLLRAGVTAYQPTLITAPPDAVRDGLRRADRLRASPEAGARILGVHLEGPFLAEQRLGAHPADQRRNPDPALLREYVTAGPVSMVTLAPELAGAEQLIDAALSHGAVVSLGHSAAPANVADAAFDRGARAVTHIFNAMPGIAGREPGIAAAALYRSDVTVMCIVDGVHLADATVRLVLRCALERLALTSDAIAAAGTADSRSMLGTVPVNVSGGRAQRADGTLAGGLGTLAGAVRHLVRLGVPLQHAVNAATMIPARLIGRSDIGVLHPGARADVVVLDESLEVTKVLIGGAPAEVGG